MQRIITIIVFYLLVLPAFSQVNIWEGTACGKKVSLTPYLASGTGNTAVVVCPGGSYFWHDTKNEGDEVGRWLQRNGISAFVLDYRTAYVPAFIFHHRLFFRGNRYPDPQDDLRQAISHVKSHAAEYGINKDFVGVMGFSAGGHLAMSGALLFTSSTRPAFVAPIYPVVTMQAPCVHKRSRRGLLGESLMNDSVLKERLSLERHVGTDCPPVFLVCCKDDSVVSFRNSILLDSALTASRVPHQFMLFNTGGHGFGASESKGTHESRQWKQAFINWLSTLKSGSVVAYHGE